MRKDESLTLLRQTMLLINLVICVFFSAIFVLTPLYAVQRSEGISFLQGLGSLPAAPWDLCRAGISGISRGEPCPPMQLDEQQPAGDFS